MIVTVISVLLIATPRPTTAQFVLSVWDYPDEYEQGIEEFEVFENSTGAWALWDYFEHDDETFFLWNVSVFIKIRVLTWLNYTLIGLTAGDDPDDGIPYFRHNVTVTTLGETIFAKNNFTYVNGQFGPLGLLWQYEYEVILDFEPAEGYTYIVTITYEVYY